MVGGGEAADQGGATENLPGARRPSTALKPYGATAVTIEVRPSDSTLGAEVRGIDLGKPLSQSSWLAIEAAFHQHGVLVFKDTRLS
jgi:hypothetical protein